MKRNVSLVLLAICCCSLLLLSGCSKTVSDYELVINNNDLTYVGHFSGTIKNKKPADGEKGSFVSGEEGSGKYFEYDGEWLDGSIYGNGVLKQESFEIEYNGKTLKGTYEGAALNGMPNGKGSFTASSKDDLIFEYTGNWKEGQISDKGELEYNKYVIEYPDGLVRTGVFKGEVLNGIPDGQGSFSTENDNKEKYTYTGSFANGRFNGIGRKMFDNGKYGIQNGTWKDNEFCPTLVERIQELGTYKNDCEYTLSDKQIEFIKNNKTAFIKHKESEYSSLINTTFDLKTYQKDPSSFSPSLVKITGLKVIQISEYEGYGGKTLTYMLACDSNYDNYFYVYKLDNTKGVVEDSTVNLVFMPLNYSTYETISGGKQWAVVGFAADILKQ